VNNRWLFVVLDDVTIPFVVRLKSVVRTVAGEAPGLPWRKSAATPAVCGVAIDVPLVVFVAVLLVCQADVRQKGQRFAPALRFDGRKRERPLGRPLEGEVLGRMGCTTFSAIWSSCSSP